MTGPNEATAVLSVDLLLNGAEQFDSWMNTVPAGVEAAGVKTAAALNQIGRNLASLTPAMAKVGADAGRALAQSFASEISGLTGHLASIQREIQAAQQALQFTRRSGEYGTIHSSPRFQIEQDGRSYYGTDRTTGQQFGGQDSKLKEVKAAAARIIEQDTADLHRAQQNYISQLNALSAAQAASQPMLTALQQLPDYAQQQQSQRRALPAGTMTPAVDFTAIEARAARVQQMLPRIYSFLGRLEDLGQLVSIQPGNRYAAPSWTAQVPQVTTGRLEDVPRPPGMARFRQSAREANQARIDQWTNSWAGDNASEVGDVFSNHAGAGAERAYSQVLLGHALRPGAAKHFTPEFLKFATGSSDTSPSRMKATVSTQGFITAEQLRNEWIAQQQDPDPFAGGLVNGKIPTTFERDLRGQLALRGRGPVATVPPVPPVNFASQPASAEDFRQQVLQETARAATQARAISSGLIDLIHNMFPPGLAGARFGAPGQSRLTQPWVAPWDRPSLTTGPSENLPVPRPLLERLLSMVAPPDPLAPLRRPWTRGFSALADNARSDAGPEQAAAQAGREAVTLWERTRVLVEQVGQRMEAFGLYAPPYGSHRPPKPIEEIPQLVQRVESSGSDRDYQQLISSMKGLHQVGTLGMSDLGPHAYDIQSGLPSDSKQFFQLGDSLGQLQKLIGETNAAREAAREAALSYDQFAGAVRQNFGNNPFGGVQHRRAGGPLTAAEYNGGITSELYDEYMASENPEGFLRELFSGAGETPRRALPAGSGGGGRGSIPPIGPSSSSFDPNDPNSRGRARRDGNRGFWDASFPNGYQQPQGQGAFGRATDFLTGGVNNLGSFVKYFASLSGAIFLFDGITRSITAALHETMAFDAASRDLNMQLDGTAHSGGAAADSLGNYAAAMGFAPSKGVEAGTVGLQVFGDQRNASNSMDIASTSTKFGTQAGLLAGVDPTTAEQQLGAVTNAYQMNFDQQGIILNAAVEAHRKYAVSLKDVLSGSAQLAATAKEAGMPVEQLPFTVAAVASRLQRTPEAVAGELTRELQGAGSTQVQNALRAADINPSGHAYADFAELAQKMQGMTDPQRQHIYSAVGGKRSSALGVYLDQLNEIQQGGAASLANPGAYLNDLMRKMGDAGQVIKNFSSSLLNLGKSIAESGLVAPFIEILKLLTPMVQLVNSIVQAIEHVSGPVGQWIVGLGEVLLLAKLIKASFGIDIIGGLAGPMMSNRGWVTQGKRAETAAATESTAVVAEGNAAAAAAKKRLAEADLEEARLAAENAVSTEATSVAQRELAVAAAKAAAADAEYIAATEKATVARATATRAAERAGAATTVTSLEADVAAATAGGAGARWASRGGNRAEQALNSLGEPALMLNAAPRFQASERGIYDWSTLDKGLAQNGAAAWKPPSPGVISRDVTGAMTVGEMGSAAIGRISGALTGLAAYAGPAAIGILGVTDAMTYFIGKAKEDADKLKQGDIAAQHAVASAQTPVQLAQAASITASSADKELRQAQEDKHGLLQPFSYTDYEGHGQTGWGHGGTPWSGSASKHQKKADELHAQALAAAHGKGGSAADILKAEQAAGLPDITAPDAITNAMNYWSATGVGPQMQSDILRRAFQGNKNITGDVAGQYITAQTALSTQIGSAKAARTGIAVEGDYAAQENQAKAIQDLMAKGYKADSPELQQAQAAMDTIGNQLNSDLHSRYDSLAALASSNRKQDDVVGRATDQINSLRSAMQNDKPDSDQYVADQAKMNELIQQRTKDQLAAAEAIAESKLDPRDTVGLINQQIAGLQASLATMDPTSAEYGNTVTQIKGLKEQGFAADLGNQYQSNIMGIDPRNTAAIAQWKAQQSYQQYLHDKGSPREAASYNQWATDWQAGQSANVNLAGQKYEAANVNPLFSGQTVAAQRALAYGNLLASYDTHGNATEATYPARIAMGQSNAQQAQYDAAAGSSRFRAGLDQGSIVDKAAGDLHDAADQLNLYQGDKNSKEYNDALIAYHQAQLEVADTARQTASIARQLGGDITDPVFMATDALKTAQQKLRDDQARNAKPDTIKADQLDVTSKSLSAQQQLFEQNFSAAQIADQLGRSSHQAYLQYLQTQHDTLTRQIAGMHKGQQGYQQAVDDLNQIDQAVKDANNQLAGQFNLGDIKVPTVYDVRRQMATSAAGLTAGQNDNRVTTVTVNGADFARVVAYLQTALGTTGASRVNVSAGPGGF